MNPREFHRLADVLAHGKGPAEFRSAISRGYYAVYLVAVEILAGMGWRISEGPAGHADVQRFLSNCGDPVIERIGSDLSDFRRTRNLADYQPGDKAVEVRAKSLFYVRMAGAMIQALDACREEPRRSAIIAGINPTSASFSPDLAPQYTLQPPSGALPADSAVRRKAP